jgi:hypothetical protein
MPNIYIIQKCFDFFEAARLKKSSQNAKITLRFLRFDCSKNFFAPGRARSCLPCTRSAGKNRLRSVYMNILLMLYFYL